MSEKLIVDKIYTASKNKFTPILVDLQNGDLVEPEKKDLQFFSAEITNESNKKIEVLATNSSIYSGSISQNDKNQLVNNFLAIRDGRSGKVKLIKVDQVTLKNHLYEEKRLAKEKEITESLSVGELMKNFGGRKAIRSLDRLEKTKVNIDIVKDQLDETLQESNVADDEQLEVKNLDLIRPPCNQEAKKIDQIFQLENLISEDLLVRLEEETDAVFQTDMESLPISSEYITERITDIKRTMNSNSHRARILIKTLLYMDGLRNFIRTKSRSLSKVNLSNVTEKIENDIRIKFSQPNSASLIKTTFTLHKAICYFIVMSLLTSKDDSISLNCLVQELSIVKKKILQFAHIVYAKPKVKSEILTFRLPSNVKTPNTYSGKRKRT